VSKKEAIKKLPKNVLNELKEKARGANEDPRIIALIFVDFIIAIIIAIGLFVYIDPETNIVPFPLNIIGFAVLITIFLYIYKFTHDFRMSPKVKQKFLKKI
jgi:acetyltransferase-like isoleucine patch superfamily enzyme